MNTVNQSAAPLGSGASLQVDVKLEEFLGHSFSGNLESDVTGLLLSAGREDTLAHCQAVAVQASELAQRFGLDREKAWLAGICHDLAAVVPRTQAVAVSRLLGLKPDSIEEQAPVLLHGPIAAAFLERRARVQDVDLLNAIRYHSTCRAGASELELALFVADKIALDPTSLRNDFVEQIREAGRQSLKEAAWLYLDWVLREGPGLGWLIHPRVEAAHSFLR